MNGSQRLMTNSNYSIHSSEKLELFFRSKMLAPESKKSDRWCRLVGLYDLSPQIGASF